MFDPEWSEYIKRFSVCFDRRPRAVAYTKTYMPLVTAERRRRDEVRDGEEEVVWFE